MSAAFKNVVAAQQQQRRGQPIPLCKDPIKENHTISRIFIVIFIASLVGCVQLADFLHTSANIRRVRVSENYTAASTAMPTPGSENEDACAQYDVGSVRDYLMGAIPFFFATMVVEFIFLKMLKYSSTASQYTPVDAWSSICMGMTQILILEVLLRVLNIRGLYCTIYTATHDKIFGNKLVSLIPSIFWWNQQSWFGYFVALVADDFVYYWFHRFSHEIGILWAAHSIHHSSERFNLSTAIRQSYLQGLFGALAKLVEAPFFHPRVHLTATQWMTNYQFWFHTCAIRRVDIPYFEYIFNTASHHRVHHDRRRHCNFAGVFIIWDRMFGTFRDERECYPAEPTKEHPEGLPNDELCLFGIYDQVKSWTECVTQIQWLEDHGFKHPISLWKGPGYFTAKKQRMLPALTDEPRIRQDDRPRGALVSVYLCVYLFWSLFALVAIKLDKRPMMMSSHGYFFSATVFVLLSLFTQGLVADRRYKFALVVELSRFLFGLFFAAAPPGSTVASILSCLVIALAWDRSPVVPPMTYYYNGKNYRNESVVRAEQDNAGELLLSSSKKDRRSASKKKD